MAGKIKAEDITSVKERTSIEAVVSEHVTLRPAGIGSLNLAGAIIPTDADGRMWLHFTERRNELYVPAMDVLAGRVPCYTTIAGLAAGALAIERMRAGPLLPRSLREVQGLE